MARYVPPEIIDEIRAKADIVEIISEYVSLKRQGKNYVGLCPFHLEDTPSFSVSPDKQIFYCFGCHKGGNIVNFIMEQDNLTLPEAAEKLAERVGVAIPETEGDHLDTLRQSQIRRLMEMHEAAADFFQECLLHPETGKEARTYLDTREITRDMVADFQLGYAPNAWDSLKQHLLNKGFSEPEMEKAGLVSKSAKGTYYDRFRNRLMFPIRDYRGKAIAFGGRVMGNELPKYLNSPETPVFNKSQNLYGIHLAASHIRQSDEAVMMEGYIDVVTARQFGVKNAVASLGTSFTADQGRLLKRYSNNVLIAYDADTAGAKATYRGLEILNNLGFRVRVLTLPNGLDPDEFFHRFNGLAWQQMVQHKAQSFLEYKLQIAVAKYDARTIEGKADAVQELLPDLARIKSQVEKDQYIKLIAKVLEIPEGAIYADLGRQSISGQMDILNNRKHTKNTRLLGNEPGALPKRDAVDNARRNLCRLMIEDRSVFDAVEKTLGLEIFEATAFSDILNLVREIYPEFDWQPATLVARADDSDLGKKVTELFMEDLPCENKEIMVRDCVRIIKLSQLKDRIDEIQTALASQGAQQVNGDVRLLLQEFSRLQQQVQELKK